MNLLEGFAAIAGLVVLTIATRGFFFLSRREWPVPAWLLQGLRFAPLAALAAVVAPEIVLDQGRLIDTWRDPRLFATAAALAWYAWRRDILGTIVTGLAGLLLARTLLGS